ncbi:MAG TPA: glycosyltransferase [Candidatus Paceibacterota bacterium]|nr:glycosyltransferase [Candidatus Paceibacterota bacterium]
MKILYGVTKSRWGGAQRYVYDLATAAKTAGFEVVVACGGNGALVTKLTEAGIRTISLSIYNEASLSAILKTKQEFEKVFEQEKPDVVHLNSSLVGIGGALAARSAHIPKIIFTDHGWAFKEARSFVQKIAIWLVSWMTVLYVDRVIAVSDAELALTQHMPFASKKTLRIYNGIDLNMQFGTGNIIRSAFPAGVHITGTVGELTKNKNQIALIEEARHKPDMYVAIVGEGELRPMLEAKIKEYGLEQRVKLFGFQPVADEMKGFDTFALPSIKEALAYVILEARAAGLPIVANRVGGIPEAMETPLSEFSKENMVEQTLALYR